MIGALAIRLAENPDDMSSLIDDAGPVAGLFVLLLGVAIFLLWRSMNKQMKRIDPALQEGPDDAQQALDHDLTEQAIERGEATEPDPDDDEPPKS